MCISQALWADVVQTGQRAGLEMFRHRPVAVKRALRMARDEFMYSVYPFCRIEPAAATFDQAPAGVGHGNRARTVGVVLGRDVGGETLRDSAATARTGAEAVPSFTETGSGIVGPEIVVADDQAQLRIGKRHGPAVTSAGRRAACAPHSFGRAPPRRSLHRRRRPCDGCAVPKPEASHTAPQTGARTRGAHAGPVASTRASAPSRAARMRPRARAARRPAVS